MKGDHRRASAAGKHHWTGLRHISRPLRPVDGESHCPALLEFAAHSEQRTHCTFRTRSTHFHEAKLLHDPSRVFPVEAVAAHDADLQIAAPVHGWNHAVVPEGIDEWPFSEALGRTFFPRYREADGRPENPDGEVSGPGDKP